MCALVQLRSLQDSKEPARSAYLKHSTLRDEYQQSCQDQLLDQHDALKIVVVVAILLTKEVER